MVNEEHAEFLLLPQVEQSLQRASAIPYNNATNVYESAGIPTDIQFGGSCLYKLAELVRTLPPEVTDTTTILSELGRTTHYAITTRIDNSLYYLDPFLWQKNPLKLNAQDGTIVDTIEHGLVIRKEPPSENSLLSVSLVDTSQKSLGILVTHNFTKSLDFLPSSSALPITPHLPSFSMQIPDLDGKHLYKVWYLKKEEIFGDIWVSDTMTGEKTKVPSSGKNSELRHGVFQHISTILGKSEQELLDYFIRARELELVMSQLMESSAHDIPHQGN